MSIPSVTNGIPQLEEESLFKPVGKKSLDQYDFMNLFITQLQHQDPMKPMDSYEMASQLAQFSNMEATLKMSDSLDKMLEYQTSQNNLQLLTLLDNNVTVAGSTLAVNEGTPGGGEFILAENVDTCVVEIYDAGGRLQKLIDVGRSEAGRYDLNWDGTDMRGDAVEDGAYTYKVKGYNALGEQAEVDYRVSGKVTGITYEDGVAKLTLDNHVAAEVGSVVGVL
ncbi:MAG: flagellar hook capping FlgD N-terminal domain-containing protein [Pseudomonadota bacterium]